MERLNELKPGEKIVFEIECVEQEHQRDDEEACAGCYFEDDCPNYIRCSKLDRPDKKDVIYKGREIDL